MMPATARATAGRTRTYHPLLRSLMQNAGLSDLMFVDVDTGEVVYSVKKRIDIGTNAVNGPWADNGLGAVVDAVATVPIGETVVSDTSFYVPARGQAVFLLATAIRSTGDATGALVAQLPVQALTDLATSGQDWELLGLDETGDVYLVGADGTLRTDTREWLDDPEQFLEEHFDRNADESLIEQMRLVGSAALTQRVDNRAVEAALSGDTFVGTVTTYDGDTAFAGVGTRPDRRPGLGRRDREGSLRSNRRALLAAPRDAGGDGGTAPGDRVARMVDGSIVDAPVRPARRCGRSHRAG